MDGPLHDPKLALFLRVERAFVAEISRRAAHTGMGRGEAFDAKQLAREYLRSLAVHQRNPNAACKDVERVYRAAEGIPGWTPKGFALAPTQLEQRITLPNGNIPNLHLRFTLQTTCWYRPADVVTAAYERFTLSEGEFDEDQYAQSAEFFDRMLRSSPYAKNGQREGLAACVGKLNAAQGNIEAMARHIGAYIRSHETGEIMLRPFYRVNSRMPFPSAQADFAAAFFTALC